MVRKTKKTKKSTSTVSEESVRLGKGDAANLEKLIDMLKKSSALLLTLDGKLDGLTSYAATLTAATVDLQERDIEVVKSSRGRPKKVEIEDDDEIEDDEEDEEDDDDDEVDDEDIEEDEDDEDEDDEEEDDDEEDDEDDDEEEDDEDEEDDEEDEDEEDELPRAKPKKRVKSLKELVKKGRKAAPGKRRRK